ncbi:MAG TPA: NDP-sugar synthase [Candidatus Eisenbacteria bacterium]|nr:NDP-sugar synthase [Candidatus Eisenbacteria bacterium]
MKAMILAAGLGTRLRPITDRLPKALVPVAGRPMIEYPLRLLRHYGIRDIIINLHHLGDQVEAYLGAGDKFGLRIAYSKETELLDTGGGLLKAKPFLAGATFIVVNTDVLIDLPLCDAIEFHRRKAATATLVLRTDPHAQRYGSMSTDGCGRIRRFLEATAPAPSPRRDRESELMFTGVQILEPEIFDFMAADSAAEKFSTTRDTYPRLLRAGGALYGFRFDGFWRDLGTLESLREAEESLEQGRVKLHYL